VGKAEALGDGAAAVVAGGAVDDRAVQLPAGEDVVEQGPAAAGHDALALRRLGEPVAELRLAVDPVDVVEADAADDRSPEPDAGAEAVVARRLLEAAADEGALVVGAVHAVEPREPAAQVGAVGVHHRVQVVGVALLPGAKFQVGVDAAGEEGWRGHGSLVTDLAERVPALGARRA
jgi:hypothetical protein